MFIDEATQYFKKKNGKFVISLDKFYFLAVSDYHKRCELKAHRRKRKVEKPSKDFKNPYK